MGMQTILILSCFLAAASSLHLLHPLFLHPSTGYGLNQAHPGGGSSFQHVSRLHKREAEAEAGPEAEADADPHLGYYGLPLAYHTGYPSWPGVRGLGFSSTAGDAVAREALSRMASPCLLPTIMHPCLSPSSTTWCPL